MSSPQALLVRILSDMLEVSSLDACLQIASLHIKKRSENPPHNEVIEALRLAALSPWGT